MTLPLAFPAIVAGSIFTFSLTLGDYILPGAHRERAVHRHRHLLGSWTAASARRSVRDGAGRRHDRATSGAPSASARSRACDGRDRVADSADPPAARRAARRSHSSTSRSSSIALYAFNENISQTWPIEHYTTKWFCVAWNDADVRDALLLSVKAALGATVDRARARHARVARGVAFAASSDARRSRSSSSSRSRCRESSPGSRCRRRS